MKFNEKLQKLRKTNGLSQEQLAEKLCVSRQAISKWESGMMPDIDNVVRISHFFDCSLDYLLNDNSDAPDEKIATELQQKPELNGRKPDLKIFVSTLMICIGVANGCLLPLWAELYQLYIFQIEHSAFTDASYYILHSPLVGLLILSVVLILFGIGWLYYLYRKKKT